MKRKTAVKWLLAAAIPLGTVATASFSSAEPGHALKRANNVPVAPRPEDVPPGATPLPAEAVRQLDEWRAAGRIPPLPVVDPATGDYKRNPDGSIVMYDPSHPDPPPHPPTNNGGPNPGLYSKGGGR